MDYLSDKHKKATLHANAISKIQNIAASNWSEFLLYHHFKDLPPHIVNQAKILVKQIEEDEMKELYNILKEYYA
jgi:hypothetical protein